jgi:hypothetical protein
MIRKLSDTDSGHVELILYNLKHRTVRMFLNWSYDNGSNLKVQHQITSIYLSSKIFHVVKKRYELMFIFSTQSPLHSGINPIVLHV